LLATIGVPGGQDELHIHNPVAPAQAGAPLPRAAHDVEKKNGFPAFAGMTGLGELP
jgi:hypothetical protein